MMIETQIVHVEAHLMDGFDPIGLYADFTVPAYTRTRRDLIDTIMPFMIEYLVRSEEGEMGASLADFAFFLLSKASDEPRRLNDGN